MDRALADIYTAHDYYSDTKTGWGIVRVFIAAGNTFSIQNAATGTTTTHTDLDSKSRNYVAEQLAEATFQQFIAIFENYFFDLLRLWLNAHPKSLGSKSVEFRRILDAPDKEAITLLVVDREWACQQFCVSYQLLVWGRRCSKRMAKWLRACFQWWMGMVHLAEASRIAIYTFFKAESL
jgi:hypothetical protein